mgnify:CR=1 FL=1
METIFEKVYVETPVDTDEDGQYDLIAVYIKRPVLDEKIPAVFVANPYMLHCNEDWYQLYDVNGDIQAYPTQNISKEEVCFVPKQPVLCPKLETTEEVVTNPIQEPDPNAYECISDLYDHLIDRGYAGVFSAGLGTRGSDGLTITGSQEEILAFKSVIDWLNGRARAFTKRDRKVGIKANWCTGNVAMSARSYLGTMCIGVATTGVEGLKTIIPEAGISNWYEYYRHNGLTLPAMDWQGDDIDILSKYCFSRALDPEDFKSIQPLFEKSQKKLQEGEDRESGNYNRFWDERNYLKRADKIQASVFVIQGLNDWNVKPDQGIRLFEKMQDLGKDRMMLLHQGQHIYTYHLQDSPTLSLIDRWLDYYLKGIDTGIQNEPRIFVESNLDQSIWQQENHWPPKQMKTYQIKEQGILTIVDDLSKTSYDRKKKNNKDWLDELVLQKNSHSLSFDLETMEESVRFAGRAKIRFKARIQQPTAILSAMLVEKGEQKRLTDQMDGEENTSFRFKVETEPSLYFVITRGWMNAQNRTHNYTKEAIDPDVWYTYSFEFVSNDYTISQGNTLSLILYGMDVDQTQLPFVSTTIEVDTSSIVVECPLK